MAPPFPSIQSFFHADTSSSPTKSQFTPVDDGFTAAEVENALHPTLPEWRPRGEYEDVDIGEIIPGKGSVSIMGRVVNFHDSPISGKAPHSAQGCIRLLVQDDTGLLAIKLYYIKIDFSVHLGQLVSIWTSHISTMDPSGAATGTATDFFTTIFPERDNTCYFMTQDQSDEGTLCKLPRGVSKSGSVNGLIRLSDLVQDGSDMTTASVLVCVKSIGSKKKFTTKKGVSIDKVDIHVFDETSESTIILWGSQTLSATFWQASHTILLLTDIGVRSSSRTLLSIDQKTLVDVNPDIPDAYWLRTFAEGLVKRQHVNPPFPEEAFDVEEITSSPLQILFSLADLDEFARKLSPSDRLTGYVSLIITSLNLVSLEQRSQLFAGECCAYPLFSNHPSTTCKTCSHPTSLRINPKIVGTLVEETGAINGGKLIWSDIAWGQLLGCTPHQLAKLRSKGLQALEARMGFLRVVLLVGWKAEVERLVVLRVMGV